MITQEQDQFWKEFIVLAVRDNISFPANLRFGQDKRYTVQEIVNLNIGSISKLGKQVVSMIAEHADSEFSESTPGDYTIESILAVDWKKFFLICIEKSKEKEATEAKSREISELQEQLEAMKTPSEKRDDMRKRLAELTGGAPAVEATATT